MALHNKIGIGLVAGVVVGVLANALDLEWLRQAISWVAPLGPAWIRLIMMIVVPLVMASLIVGTASLGDITRLGRIGGKTVGFYLGTTTIAITIGLVLSNLVRPGRGVDEATQAQLMESFGGDAAANVQLAQEAPGIMDVVLNIIPRNPVEAAANGDMLPIIFFSLMFGAALSLVQREPRETVLGFFNGVNDVAMIMVDWVMRLAPYAVFVLLADVVGQFGLDLLRSLALYMLTVIFGLALHAFGTYALAMRLLARFNPIEFFRRIRKVPIIAFSTSSSNATLPVTIESAEEDLGVSNEVASFVLPLGATINMDGTALYQGVAVMFIAQVVGIDLTWQAQLMVVLTATLASIGAAGVPSAGIIILTVVLAQAGVPEAGIALILGVDRVLDMCRTAVNVTGDLTCSAFVARSEGEELTPRPIGVEEAALRGATVKKGAGLG
ncbi:MAG: dicarboxylate/amino acid:cation symporter [Gemmatimonadetes bacterium]|uniref:Dicarboxylate/amino acid:cation symporter n=1 Tax=Candidatus Kutchimonas denitrificans TaxID=3056748 RepID=A0AAE4Z801_9BACT|nr:dicarboxylate/amino acid:cation symporter [Gemmatimonadota bacterium]NIR75489.1 dicarboxylate/amino acid:cation symporter [Candidatus Kutchimonas denitrificans]NIS01803.1 dicarboxylate/amino acid:cation symporter [Gemmatimonadota bacterium]NIT67584.1 dicarboxylate/amino acid:cation symporter [Gemmatimonadota bacterium]NIU53458.1 cation:dicarboxylase symporter family transporter [Gemmatimonadota bacterium]